MHLTSAYSLIIYENTLISPTLTISIHIYDMIIDHTPYTPQDTIRLGNRL